MWLNSELWSCFLSVESGLCSKLILVESGKKTPPDWILLLFQVKGLQQRFPSFSLRLPRECETFQCEFPAKIAAVFASISPQHILGFLQELFLGLPAERVIARSFTRTRPPLRPRPWSRPGSAAASPTGRGEETTADQKLGYFAPDLCASFTPCSLSPLPLICK